MEYLIILLATLFFPTPVLLLHSSHILFELKFFFLCYAESSVLSQILFPLLVRTKALHSPGSLTTTFFRKQFVGGTFKMAEE